MDTLLFLFGNYYGSDWAGMILMCISIYMLGSHHRHGFTIGVISCVAWFIFGILTGSIPDMLTQVLLTILYIRGYVRWTPLAN